MASNTKLLTLLDAAIKFKSGKNKKITKQGWEQLANELEVVPETTIYEMKRIREQLVFNPPLETHQKKQYERCDQCGSLVLADKPCYVCKIKEIIGEE
jgi:formylmethanofuran dehydrogenase subunit E